MSLGRILKISLIHKEINKTKKISKANIVTHDRGAPQSPLTDYGKASLTLEAALVFPIAFFALYSILFFFCVLQTSIDTKGALTAAASRLSLELAEDEEAYGRNALYFYLELKEKGVDTRWISRGAAGVQWKGTETKGEDVALRIQYKCRLPVSVFGIREVPISQQAVIRKWIGAGEGAAEAGEDTWVYVTQEGTVYHRSRECTHLALSIRTASRQQAMEYAPCQKCGSGPQGACYYVTDEGERYHTTLSCSGLKRTIYLVALSEIPGYYGCSRCGGQ